MGDCCLIVEFGQRVDSQINQITRAFAEHLLSHPIPGVYDVVPTYTTVAVHYHPESFLGDVLPWQRLQRQLEAVLTQGIETASAVARVVEVPVYYGGDQGPDLIEVAQKCGLAEEEVVQLHSSPVYTVYMLGFLPGFPYIGGLDKRLNMPRRKTPRTTVPAGSVAIAGEQAAIYPMESPGGWNLIGRTPVTLFQPQAEPPCLLQPGDKVRFVPISFEQFQAMQRQ